MGNGLVSLQKIWVLSGQELSCLNSEGKKKKERQRMQRMKRDLMWGEEGGLGGGEEESKLL